MQHILLGSAASWKSRDEVTSPTISASPGFDSANSDRPEWRRALYEKQPFEDNYVDPVQFLQEMRKNENVATYNFSDIVEDTFVVIQQLSIVVIFVNMFVSIVRSQVALGSIVVVDVGAVILALIFYSSTSHSTPKKSRWAGVVDACRQSFVLVALLLILSPIFQTLTVTYTDDTIWALTIISLAVNVLGTDYGYLNGHTNTHSHSLSTNAALFACVMLASRIPSAAFASALLGFGTLCFVLSPSIRYRLKCFSKVAHVGVTFLLCGVALGCLSDVPLLVGLFVGIIFTISVAVPWFFVSLQMKFKYQINGPWDEAQPQNSAAAKEWANAGLLS